MLEIPTWTAVVVAVATPLLLQHEDREVVAAVTRTLLGGSIRAYDGTGEVVVRDELGLGAPIIDVKGPGFSQLGDHFSPLLAVFAPAYALFPTPVTLLVGQAALFALSAAPVSRVAVHFLGIARGLTGAAAYLNRPNARRPARGRGRPARQVRRLP